MKRLIVYLNETEHDALLRSAKEERRDPRAQAALMIRQELQRRGLLPAAEAPAEVKSSSAEPAEAPVGATDDKHAA